MPNEKTAPDAPSNEELLKMIAGIQQQQTAAPAALATAGNPGWGAPQPVTDITPIGVSIPMKIETEQGSLRVMVNLGPESITGPESLTAAIQALENKGFPLDFWKSKKTSWGGGSNGGYNKGGGNYR